MNSKAPPANRTPGFVRCLLYGSVFLSVLAAAAVQAQSAPAGKILFASDQGNPGRNQVYVMEADGTVVTNLSQSAYSDFAPAWSPDGTRIAFTRYVDGKPQIFVMDADGSNQTNLSAAVASSWDMEPSWSPDGTMIAFTGVVNSNYDVWVMNVSAPSSRTRLTTDSQLDVSPAWSPDGTKIAFRSNRYAVGGTQLQQIWVMSAEDGSGQTNLSQSAYHDNNPAWSPDGTLIAFSSGRAGDGHTQVYVMNADGTNQHRVLASPSGYADQEPAWSPDGSQLAFVRIAGTSYLDFNYDIYKMDATGLSAPTRLTAGTSWDAQPDWQPAAQSDRDAPTITCDPPSTVWSRTNVTIHCTASDEGSGLADPADASFTLVTSVADGSETDNAVTDSHQVCDLAGNCATAGPFGGNKVDRKAPTITLTVPANGGAFLLDQPVTPDYVCEDFGSGVDRCVGSPVLLNDLVDTSWVGTKTFQVSASDWVGNESSATRTYTVSFVVTVEQDTGVLRLRLENFNGVNASSPSIALTILAIDGVFLASPVTFGYVDNGGNSHYRLAVGRRWTLPGEQGGMSDHTLTVTATGDPVTHTATVRY